jgi:hypothetical protein
MTVAVVPFRHIPNSNQNRICARVKKVEKNEKVEKVEKMNMFTHLNPLMIYKSLIFT